MVLKDKLQLKNKNKDETNFICETSGSTLLGMMEVVFSKKQVPSLCEGRRCV
jgi:hypothetical protein